MRVLQNHIRSVLSAARFAAPALLDLIYPNTCLGCTRKLAGNHRMVCHRCILGLERADPELIESQLEAHDVDEKVVSVFALWVFDKRGTLQRIQHTLKYRNLPALGHMMGGLLGEALTERLGTMSDQVCPDIIVPIPLSRVRLYERGYNQSTLLAEGTGNVMNIPVWYDLLVRSRSTQTQTALAREKRWKNVFGAFRVGGPGEIAGKHFLIVDDVLTTGATLLAAAHPLIEAGAASVQLATLCFARF